MTEIFKALNHINYGVYIVASCDGEGKFNGQISNAVMQLTAEPMTVAAAVNKKNLTHDYILKSGVFSVNVLTEGTPMVFIGKFGFKTGRNIDKFSDTEFFKGVTGAPVIKTNVAAYLEAKVINAIDVFTHTLFIGEVKGGQCFGAGKAMTYDYYHNVLKAKTPVNASTFQAAAPKKD